MMSSDPKEKALARNKIIEKLSCASIAYNLKLPKPTGSIYKQALGLKDGQGVTKKTSFQQKGQIDRKVPTSPCQKKAPQVHPKGKDVYDFKTNAKESFRKFIIRDEWAMLEREMRMAEIENPLPAVKMPLITLEELKIHLHENFGWKKSSGPAISISEDSFSQCLAEIDGFIAEAERTRILAIHIGGHDPHQENQRCPGIKEEKVPIEITLVAFNGVMLKFSDIPLIPSPLQNILSDVAYAKISSTPDTDCQLLQKFSIRLRGWIHSGAVFRALVRNESRFDIQTQAKYLEFSGLMDHQTNSSHDFAWVPIAITLASAINFALKRSYPSTHQMFPVIWEAIELVRLRVPEDLENISRDPIKNWMAGMDFPEEIKHRNVNDAASMQGHRKMSADFVEIFDPAYNPKEAAMWPFQFFVDPNRNRIRLPFARSLKESKLHLLLESICKNCGVHRHTAQTCPDLKGQLPVCNYPHDNVSDLPPHSIHFCPILHHFCDICPGTGHHNSVHLRKDYTMRELRERFFQHAHLGYLTSLPFLNLIPMAQSRISTCHFRGGFLGMDFRRDSITRYQLGLGAQECAPYLRQSRSKLLDRDQLVAVKMDLIKKNAAADDPRDIVPIRRDILNVVQKKHNEELDS